MIYSKQTIPHDEMFLATGGAPPARGPREIPNFWGNFDAPAKCWLHRSPMCSTGRGLYYWMSHLHHTSISTQLGVLRLLKLILKFIFQIANPCTDWQFCNNFKTQPKLIKMFQNLENSNIQRFDSMGPIPSLSVYGMLAKTSGKFSTQPSINMSNLQSLTEI